MAHFGVISPPVPGHLNPMFAVSAELRDRGHRITFFHMQDVEPRVLREGFEFCPLGSASHPPGTLPASLSGIAARRGMAALRFTIGEVRGTTGMFCRDLPAAIQRTGVDALLVDQTEPAGSLVARHLGMPFVTLCNALLMNRDPEAPPPFTAWRYHPGPFARLRNLAGYAASAITLKPVTSILNGYRRKWNLPTAQVPDDDFSALAQISQQPATFEFPRTALPRSFRFAGPFRKSTSAIPFPWERLDGRPLVYASLGTLQNRNFELFQTFAEATRKLPVQLVLSHGGGLNREQTAALPSDAIIVDYAPQTEVLARCQAAITHAGLNTVLDCLTHGVPMVAIPITYEQPAIAERVRWTGCGKVLPLKRTNSSNLRLALNELLANDSYRSSAAMISKDIAARGGANEAATCIESILNVSVDGTKLARYNFGSTR